MVRFMNIFAVVLVLAPLAALAQALDPSNTDAFLNALATAVGGGQWRVAVVLAIVGVVYLLKTQGSKIPGKVGVYLASSQGGATVALLFSVASSLAAIIVAGKSLGWKDVVDALLMGFTAIGTWTGVRRILNVGGAAGAVVDVPAVPVQPPKV